MANKFNLSKKLQAFEQLKKDLPPILANDSEKFFRSGFAKEGFTDATYVRWKERKRPSKRNKKILSYKGILKNSIKRTSATFSNITISTRVPYAQIHNEGGVINKKARSGTLNFKISRGRSRFARQRNANFQQDVNFSAHKVVIPQRKFMGISRTLERQHLKKIKLGIQISMK